MDLNKIFRPVQVRSEAMILGRVRYNWQSRRFLIIVIVPNHQRTFGQEGLIFDWRTFRTTKKGDYCTVTRSNNEPSSCCLCGSGRPRRCKGSPTLNVWLLSRRLGPWMWG